MPLVQAKRSTFASTFVVQPGIRNSLCAQSSSDCLPSGALPGQSLTAHEKTASPGTQKLGSMASALGSRRNSLSPAEGPQWVRDHHKLVTSPQLLEHLLLRWSR
jgi:hypothetical protein